MQRNDSNNDSDRELKVIDEVLGKNKIESPSSNFTHRVMMNLHSMPVATSLSPKKGLFLLGGTIIAIALLTSLLGGGVFDTMNETIQLPDMKYTQGVRTTIPVSGNLVMKGLIGLNIVLAFVLFDRTVLKPFFNRRAMR